MSFIEELKRRNVFRVGIAYVLMSWVLLQGADFVLDVAGAPDWVIRTLIVVVAVGLPIALFFAWAFEVTPEGIKREAEVDRSGSIAPQTGRKLDRAIIVFLALALVLVLGERFFFAGKTESEPMPAQQASSNTPVAAAKSVAVLPFSDLSRAGDQGWFASGLAEEILNALVRVPDLRVAPLDSSLRFSQSDQPIDEVASELGVANVLKGSVRSDGDRIRVTAQLIRVADGKHLFSENYDRDISDMIGIQEDLAQNIATALETSMDPAALAEMSRVGTTSVAAYQAYLRGLQLRQNRVGRDTGEPLMQSYQQFEEARRLDPKFSDAHLNAARFWKIQLTPSRIDSGLTELDARQLLANYQERMSAAEQTANSDLERLLIAADRAEVELRLRDALQNYQRYLEERPNDSPARASAIMVAMMLKDRAAGRQLLGPLIERANTDSGSALGIANFAYRLISPSEAADLVSAIMSRWPNDPGLLYQAHRTFLWAGRYGDAADVAARFRALAGQPVPLLEARQACADGDREAAQAWLDQMPEDELDDIWLIEGFLGNAQRATDVLRQYELEGVPYQLATFAVYPQFDPRPFPTLMSTLQREGVTRFEPVDLPFACPPPEITSIAVLAFENMSPDAENEYFADGISEEILNVLTGLSELRVIARTSAFSFKGTGATVSEIAGKLGVGYVLEGSVRKSGNRVRVTAQLIETGNESHLWSETYDRELDDIFAVQDEIARAIAGQLKLQLTPDQQVALVEAPTDNLEAYNKYLQGRQLWHSRGIQNLQVSAALLEQAVELDPDFAEAWAALADSWLLIPEYSESRSMETIPRARDAVNRALELKPGMPQALTTRAYLRFMYDYDWVNAERDFKRAIELDPGYATAHQWYGEFLAIRDRDVDGALAQVMTAAKLDPLAPVMWNVAGFITAWTGRFEESTGYYRRTLEIEPAFDAAYANLAFIYVQTGDFETAREMWRRGAALTDDSPDEFLRFIDALEDPTLRPAYLDSLADSRFWVSGAVDRAVAYMMLGDAEGAMTDLELSLEAGYPYATHVNRMKIYDPLRDTPRFQAHLAKMNLWPPAE